MNTNILFMCADCSNLRKINDGNKYVYYCQFVTDVIPNGAVDVSMDASDCIRRGRFVQKRGNVK